MQISITNPILQTIIFELLLLGAILFSLRKKTEPGLSMAVTDQVKGLAILAVALSHVGYFLVTDNRFLFPLSVYAGVGVDAFLLFSGFGLTISMLRRRLSPGAFYRKRLSKLYLPWWVCLCAFVLLDYFLLHKTYAGTEIWQAALGFFPHANLYQNIDSPLWYFTFIVSYYIVFPLIFWKRFPTVSAGLLFALYYLVIPNYVPAPIDWGVRSLYTYHILAFPLGIVLAHVASFSTFWSVLRARGQSIVSFVSLRTRFTVRLLVSAVLIYVLYYLGLHSWVGKGIWPEQLGSLLSVAILIVCVVVLPFESRVLRWLGVYSYEIYLLHWPLMYRHDMLYALLPAGLATFLSFVTIFGLAVILQKTIGGALTGFDSAAKSPAQTP